jgi:uncharacterized membrane protein YgcG
MSAATARAAPAAADHRLEGIAMTHKLIAACLVAAVLIPVSGAIAQDKTQTRQQEQIYGSQMMTQRERNEYSERMRAAKTADERERVRAEHHERMQARAKERGAKLPDQPPARKGTGMSPGGGMGSGGGGGMGGGRGGR